MWAHMLLMLLASLALFPLGIAAARERRRGGRWRARVHAAVQGAGAAVVVVGFALGVAHTARSGSGGEHFSTAHGRVGLAIVVLLAVQCLLGCANLARAPPRWIRWLHTLVGTALVVLVVPQVVLGLISYSDHCAVPVVAANANTTTSTDGMMGAAMTLSFDYNGKVVVLAGWTLDYVGVYVGTLVLAAYLGVVFELLRQGRLWPLVRPSPTPTARSTAMALEPWKGGAGMMEGTGSEGGSGAAPPDDGDDDAAGATSPLHATVVPTERGDRLAGLPRRARRAALAGLRVVVSYAIMYLLMTYDAGILVALIVAVVLTNLALEEDWQQDYIVNAGPWDAAWRT